MNRNRKVKVASVASLSLVAGIVMGGNAQIQAEAAPIAGATAMISTNENVIAENSHSTLSGVNKALANIVSDANESAEEKITAQKEKEAKEAARREKLGVAQVDSYVNVREKADKSAKATGKLYKNNIAKVEEKSGDWYKVRSGDVEGYVKSDYLKVGDDKTLEEAATKIATVDTEVLNVRKGASKKSQVMGTVRKDENLTVVGEDSENSGWVKVTTSSGSGYVSADYVKLTTKYSHGETVAQEQARLSATEEEQTMTMESSGSTVSAASEVSGSASGDVTVTSDTTPSSTVSSGEASQSSGDSDVIVTSESDGSS